MSTWSDGYVAEIGYTYGHYSELNPHRLALPLLYAGFVVPPSGHACELGFGQGMSVNLNAAASDTRWWGTDFNPAQVGFAQELAAAAGSDARLTDQSFAEFCARDDLPEFDFIAMHGIWSWISDANRGIIVDFVRRKLRVGGVLFVSYNTMPGWSAMAPLRHLMAQFASSLCAPGHPIGERIGASLDFVERLLATQPMYAHANPLAAQRLALLRNQDRNYLAHEYFNENWDPMFFSRTADLLADAKLSFACSANHLDHVPSINFSEEQSGLLNAIPDATLRETTRDFMLNTQFRRDYWVKGARRLGAAQRAAALRALRMMLVVPAGDVEFLVSGARGEGQLNRAVYEPIVAALADHVPRTLGEIEQALGGQVTISLLAEVAMVLAHKGDLVALPAEAPGPRARERCARLNHAILERARESGDITYLASPITGSGVGVARIQQLFLLARMAGAQGPEQWVDFAWDVMRSRGQRLAKDGRPLQAEEDNLAALREEVAAFEARLPVLRALDIAR